MTQIILFMTLGIFLWGAGPAEARTCRDEPERCPVTLWSCSQPLPKNVASYSYFSAVVTGSVFGENSVTVKEHSCIRSQTLTCQERNAQEWILYPQIPQGQLVNQISGQRIAVDCRKYNNWP